MSAVVRLKGLVKLPLFCVRQRSCNHCFKNEWTLDTQSPSNRLNLIEGDMKEGTKKSTCLPLSCISDDNVTQCNVRFDIKFVIKANYTISVLASLSWTMVSRKHETIVVLCFIFILIKFLTNY